jgi:mRNA interferase MazF
MGSQSVALNKDSVRKAPKNEAKAEMKQYEIRWANLPDPVGRRPILLLSRNGSAEYLSRLVVVEITTKVRGIPQEVKLGPRDGMDRTCVANLDNIQALSKEFIGKRISALSGSRHREIKQAMGFALGWPELIDTE